MKGKKKRENEGHNKLPPFSDRGNTGRNRWLRASKNENLQRNQRRMKRSTKKEKKRQHHIEVNGYLVTNVETYDSREGGAEGQKGVIAL